MGHISTAAFSLLHKAVITSIVLVVNGFSTVPGHGLGVCWIVWAKTKPRMDDHGLEFMFIPWICSVYLTKCYIV